MLDYDEELQIVHKNVKIPFIYEDISHMNSLKEQEKRIANFLQSGITETF